MLSPRLAAGLGFRRFVVRPFAMEAFAFATTLALLATGCGSAALSEAKFAMAASAPPAPPSEESAASTPPGYPPVQAQDVSTTGADHGTTTSAGGAFFAMGNAAPNSPAKAPPNSTIAASQREPSKEETRHQDGSMIVYTAHVTLAVYQVQAGLGAVENRARELGGYLAQKSDASITVRIPRDRFRDALASVEQLGDVVHRQIDAQDVSDQYVDLEARARNARVTRDRLEELLKRAAVKEAIEIQGELSRVTEELERIEGQLKLLRSKFAFATITVTFAARPTTSVPQTKIELPFPWLSQLGLGHLLSL